MSTGHQAVVTPVDAGFLVTCPHGCKLGKSASQPTRTAAERRAETHRYATLDATPLTPHAALWRIEAELSKPGSTPAADVEAALTRLWSLVLAGDR